MAVKKTRNGGQWTESRFRSFIKSALRSASNRWPPKYETLKAARVEKGKYRCVGYNRSDHVVPVTIMHKRKRQRNIFVDHVVPVIPIGGFTSWDDCIERLFCEKKGLQVLCGTCHSAKTKQEKEERKLHGKSPTEPN